MTLTRIDLNIIDPEKAIFRRVSYYNCVPLNRYSQYSGLCHFNQRNLSTSIRRKIIENTKLERPANNKWLPLEML